MVLFWSHSAMLGKAARACRLLFENGVLVVVMVMGVWVLINGAILVVVVAVTASVNGIKPWVRSGAGVRDGIGLAGQVVILVLVRLKLATTGSGSRELVITRAGLGGTLGSASAVGLVVGQSDGFFDDPVAGVDIDEVARAVRVPFAVPGAVFADADAAGGTDVQGARRAAIAVVALLDATVLGIPITVGARRVVGNRLQRPHALGLVGLHGTRDVTGTASECVRHW